MRRPGVFSGLFAPALLAALVPGALTALSASLTGAWARERPWSWWAEFVLGLAAVGWTLLLPDSRARIQRPATPSRPPSWRARR
ncbi:hypothetical protein [Geodermatophilus sp. URMC 64]